MSTPLIAVSGANMTSGRVAIRDIGRSGLRVIGTAPSRPRFNWHSRWSSAYLVLPSPREAAGLLDLLRRADVDAMLPMESAYVGALCHQAAIGELGLQVALPSLDAFICAYDNGRTIELCESLGIPAPRRLHPEEATGAVVVKPREDAGAARGVSFCRDAESLRRALANCCRFGTPMVQELIPGDTQAMRTVVLLFDYRSRLVTHFTTQKLEQYPGSGGVTAMSISTDEPALVETVLPFFESLRWRGPAEVELKVDARDGIAKVIEVNPRLPGYVAFPISCGLHLPRLAALVALGESPSAPDYAIGRRYVQPVLTLKALLQARSAGEVNGKRLRRDCRALLTASWVSWDDIVDPLPRLARMLAEARGVDGGLAAEDGLVLAELEQPPVEPATPIRGAA